MVSMDCCGVLGLSLRFSLNLIILYENKTHNKKFYKSLLMRKSVWRKLLFNKYTTDKLNQ